MSYECDKCGADVGNGGIDKCSTVSTVDPADSGTIVHYRFCLETCTPKVFNSRHLTHRNKEK